MPFRDDLIERTIEQLSQILSRMLLHQSPPSELETFLQESYQKHVGIQGSLLAQLSSQDILSTLSSTGQLDKEKSYLLAALLEAQSALETSDPINLKLKALDLYLEAALANVGVMDIHQRIETLRLDLKDFILPETTEWRFFDYEVLSGSYASAETRLFELKENLAAHVHARGLVFYQTLKQLSDDVLEQGGLSREEVESGLHDFSKV